jgi:hypothetical protein
VLQIRLMPHVLLQCRVACGAFALVPKATEPHTFCLFRLVLPAVVSTCVAVMGSGLRSGVLGWHVRRGCCGSVSGIVCRYCSRGCSRSVGRCNGRVRSGQTRRVCSGSWGLLALVLQFGVVAYMRLQRCEASRTIASVLFATELHAVCPHFT